MTYTAKTLGQLIKYSRIEMNLTTRALAQKINISHVQLFRIEADNPIPSINSSSVQALIKFFGWNTAEINKLIHQTQQLKKNYEDLITSKFKYQEAARVMVNSSKEQQELADIIFTSQPSEISQIKDFIKNNIKKDGNNGELNGK